MEGGEKTRGQWPYRLRSTRAMENLSGGLKSLGGLQFQTSNLEYPGIHVHIAPNSHFGVL